MDRALILPAVVPLLFCACGWLFSEGDVEVTSDGAYLIIKNGRSAEIYYEAALDGALPANWLASFDDDHIDADERKSIPYGNIFTGDTLRAASGDQVVVFWWDNGMRSNNDCTDVYVTLK